MIFVRKNVIKTNEFFYRTFYYNKSESASVQFVISYYSFNRIETELKYQTDDQNHNNDDSADDLGAKSISWWKYLLPFHYFV